MTYPIFPRPNKPGILDKGVSQNEEEKLLLFKRFQCLLYSSQSHTKLRIWTHKTHHLHDFGRKFLELPSHSFLQDYHTVPRNTFPYGLDICLHVSSNKTFCYMLITLTMGTKLILQGPVMKNMIHVYKIWLPWPGQSSGGNTMHLCAA